MSRAASGLAPLLALLCATGPARASLPDIASLGARSPALAGAGTALIEGYDATYVNPAGLYGTPRRLTLGVVYGGYRVTLDGDPRPIDNTAGLVIGAGLPLPLGGALRDRLALGFGFYLPFGVINRARAPFPEVPWAPLIESRTQVVSVLIGAGARLPAGLTAGFGILALAALVGETRIAADPTGRIGAASQSQLTVHYAPIVGLRWRGLADLLAVGVTYRAASLSTFRNTVRSQLGDTVPVELPTIVIAGVGQFDPHQIAAEVNVRPSARLVVIGNLTWKHWSAYRPPIEPATAGAAALPPADYHDTVVPRLAVEWQPPGGEGTGQVLLRLGYFYEWSPAPADEDTRTLLDASRHVACFGVGHRLPLRLPLQLDAYLQWHQLAGSARLAGGFAVAGMTLGVDL